MEWQTVYAFMRGLYWWLFPQLQSSEGNKQQNYFPSQSTQNVRYDSTCIIVLLAWQNELINGDKTTTSQLPLGDNWSICSHRTGVYAAPELSLCSVQEMQEPWAIGSSCKTMDHSYCKVYNELRGNGSLWIWNIHKSRGGSIKMAYSRIF